MDRLSVDAVGFTTCRPQRGPVPESGHINTICTRDNITTEHSRSVDAYSDQTLSNLQIDLSRMRKLLHVLAAATLVCSVSALRLPELDAKIDVKTNLSEARLAVHKCICAQAIMPWLLFSQPNAPWSLQVFADRFGGCRLPDSDFLEGVKFPASCG